MRCGGVLFGGHGAFALGVGLRAGFGPVVLGAVGELLRCGPSLGGGLGEQGLLARASAVAARVVAWAAARVAWSRSCSASASRRRVWSASARAWSRSAAVARCCSWRSASLACASFRSRSRLASLVRR
ncbi:hypothetical protein [Actinomadura harenae]|uniref:Uncharacterized protein n=1 Tax=Actinomadura harenae TaxID=2483351 RepID=A0A3M2LGC8_9ACTN|nr:hypothetical protein [Actinomadura harenae]RMI33778.1 hypothetical protein EBO15_41400 [Actinomadura harenae]